MGRLFEIRTVNELHHILNLQRSVTRQATLALDEIVKGVSTPSNQEDEEYLGRITMERECLLLEKYARLPTLTEHERNPSLKTMTHTGATFGVAAIVGEVILSHIRTIANKFPNAHRMLLMVMLAEFDKPVSEDIDLVDTFVRSMKVELTETLAVITEEERKRLLRAMLHPVAEAMVLVCKQYKLLAHEEEGWVITPIGQRVMMHLFDAQRFIDSVADAHKRLQSETK